MLVVSVFGDMGIRSNATIPKMLRSSIPLTLRLLGLFGAFWGKVWALGAKVWDPIMRVQEH